MLADFISWLEITTCFICTFVTLLGINDSYQMGVFRVLAAILHLGNVEVKDRDADSSTIQVGGACVGRWVIWTLMVLNGSSGYCIVKWPLDVCS